MLLPLRHLVAKTKNNNWSYFFIWIKPVCPYNLFRCTKSLLHIWRECVENISWFTGVLLKFEKINWNPDVFKFCHPRRHHRIFVEKPAPSPSLASDWPVSHYTWLRQYMLSFCGLAMMAPTNSFFAISPRWLNHLSKFHREVIFKAL